MIEKRALRIEIRGRKGFANGMSGKAVCRSIGRLTGIKGKGSVWQGREGKERD